MNLRNHITDVVAAEQAFIGSALLKPDAISVMAATIQPQHLVTETLSKLWGALIYFDAAGKLIDMATLSETGKRIWGDSGAFELQQLFTVMPTAARWRYYASIIVDAYRLRNFKSLASGIQKRVDDLAETPATIEQWISEQLESEIGTSSIKSITAHDAGIQLLNAMESERAHATIETGITAVDRNVCGFTPGELIVLAGRPGNCKTAFALQIAEQAAEAGQQTLFVSLEMTGDELMTRVLCGRCGIDSRVLRSQTLSADDKRKLHEENEQLETVPLFVQATHRVDIRQLNAMARIQANSTGLKFMVVDYIGLIDKGQSKLERREQVAEWSRSLKVMAKELGIPILILVQLNRATDTQPEPRLSNLAESGAIEQDADVVMFMHRSKPDKNEFKLMVVKHRHADLSSHDVYLDVRTMKMKSDCGTEWTP